MRHTLVARSPTTLYQYSIKHLKMKSLLVYVCLLFAAIATSLYAQPSPGFSWSNCSTPADMARVTVQSVLVTPYYFKKGMNVTLTANFTLKESIVGGSIGTAEVKIAGFLFQNQTYDLCNTALRHVGLKCPVAAGKYNVSMTTQIPIISPRGQYTATARAMDPTGKELVCINVAFEIQ